MNDAHGPTPRTLLSSLVVLRRWKWVVIQTIVLVPAAALLFSWLQEPLYRASAEVLLSRQSLAAALTGIPDAAQNQDPVRLAQTQADLAQTREVARRVVRATEAPRTVRELLRRSTVEPRGGSDLLVFEVTDRSPRLARRLATAYAQQFMLYRQQLDTGTLRAARLEVEDRIQALLAASERDEDLYALLVDKEQQLRTLEALQTANVSVVQEADTAKQIQPRPVRNGVAGGLLGIVVGIGLAFLLEALDRRVRSAEEASERLDLPLLARIPVPPRSLRRGQALVMLADPRGGHAEAYRMLRTNLEFAALGRDVRAVVITSALGGEGKSTTASNLAIASARSGRRTILVDLDLRKPTIDQFLGVGRRPGATDAALGHVAVDDALRPVPTLGETGAGFNGDGGAGNLRVLPAGTLPPNPGEFAASPQLAEVLGELRSRADLVIVDAPPLLAVGDALALSACVDGVVAVVNVAKARRPVLAEFARVLARSQAPVLGLIATGGAKHESYAEYYGTSGDAEEVSSAREVIPAPATKAAGRGAR